MKATIVRRVCASACASALALVGVSHSRALAGAPDVWAITGARIVPVSGPPIDNGTVVLRRGIIESVGATVTIPPDARVLDGHGMTVYPGLIDAYSFVEEDQQDGATPPRARGPRGGDAKPPSLEDPPGVTPNRDALDVAKADGKVEAARNAGITTVLAVPKGGVFRGTSALLDMAGETPREMSVRSPVAQHVAFEPQGGFAGYPGSLMGVIAVIRQKLLDARHYEQEWARYNAAPRGLRRPVPDAKLSALVPVADGALPVVIEASADKEIRRALRLTDELKLKTLIGGGLGAASVAGELKSRNIPVLLSVNYPERSADLDPETKEPLRVVRERVDAPGVAARLEAAGVRFAFASFGLKSPGQFRPNVRKAVEAGLGKDDALRAMTLSPAEILGVSEQLGSIEPGKIANLLVADGDLFDEKTKITFVFVDGERFEIKVPPAPKTGEAPTATAAGSWEITAVTPDGPQTVKLELTQSGSEVAGTFSHPMFGSATVRSGQISGNKVTFSVTVNVQGSTLDVDFAGTIDGDSMSGTVVVPGTGTLEFSGKRTPRGGRTE